MKNVLGRILLLAALAGFACWQIRDGARKDVALKAQAEELRLLRQEARNIDTALGQWRHDYARIAGERQDKRERTRQTVRRDPSLREHLAAPLHPALLPDGGLLGRPGPAPDTPRTPATGSGP